MDLVIAVTIGTALLVFAMFVIGVMIAKFYRKVEQGKALIVNKMKAEPEVTFTGATVLPIIHKAEVMDISVKTIEIDRRAKDGLICRDNIRADIKVTFFVRVNKTVDDVIKVAQSIGCMRASDPGTLEALFSAKFSEGLKTVGKQLDFVDLYTKRHEFRDAIINLIGRDLNGYVLEDAAIDYLEQTPISHLDPMNILDAQGIRKITELTATEHVKTNESQNTEKKLTKKQDVEAAEAIMELERQQADAMAKQQREIESVRAREAAELQKIQAEERLRSEQARIITDEQVAIAEQNKHRQIEVAQKNRERVVGIETERVEKDRALEQVMRERAVELSRIEKEKALEVERKNIQDVIRERVAVEHSVVEQEERIKTLKVVEDANRSRQAVIIAAEAEAQEKLVKDIKAAEAAEQAATHQAKERVTRAEAELEAADREAKAKIRIAEGVQAQTAAPGLAEAKVKEADAVATEKYGLAQIRVKEADAAALQKLGTAEATVLREKALAEAQGIQEKAHAMAQLDEATRTHEEFRLRIENERLLGVESIKARLEVEQAKATILGEALRSAKIDIVGGDGQFLDRVVNSIGLGKSIDSLVSESSTAQAVLDKLGVKLPETPVIPVSPKVPVVRAD
ncbi:MAG TPA: flotillin family protein [Thermoanaerobaculia bacterium]|nr:flotillin family protein [Thermoanaerobaculia bacterium]